MKCRSDIAPAEIVCFLLILVVLAGSVASLSLTCPGNHTAVGLQTPLVVGRLQAPVEWWRQTYSVVITLHPGGGGGPIRPEGTVNGQRH